MPLKMSGINALATKIYFAAFAISHRAVKAAGS